MNLRINCFYVRKCVLLNSLLYLYITRHLFGLIKCIHNNLFLSPNLFGITDSFAFTTLAVPKSCYSLGARTTFDRGASFCSLLPALQALATSLRMTYRFVIANAVRRVAIRFSLKGYLRILSRSAFRMTPSCHCEHRKVRGNPFPP